MSRLRSLIRARPKRCALGAAVLVMLLAAAAVTVLRTPGSSRSSEPGAAASGRQPVPASTEQAPGGATTSRGDATGSPGSVLPAPGSPASGTALTGPAGQPGAPPPSGGGSQPPGPAGGPTRGDVPVAPRPPVRCPSTGSPRAAPLPAPDERDGRRWVAVGRLAGSCDDSSTPFHLQGVDTRLAWRSDADAFAAFVVDATRGRDATAGFADAQCAAPCSENQPLVLAAGDYRLEVQAGSAPWEVEVQEYRRP